MHIKHIILTSTVALSLLGASMVSANQETTKNNPSIEKHQHDHKGFTDKLTSQQRDELKIILQSMRKQMAPLMKEKRALKLQLMGKIATPNTQWSAVTPLVNSINDINAKITTLYTKIQFTVFQKYGVLLPSPHGKHFHGRQIADARGEHNQYA